MIFIGDVHGCYDTLLALLAKIPQEEKDKGIVFCGDLIDRGPKSRQVVEFVRKNNHHCVLGNHEQMMIDYSHNRDLHRGNMWTLNGGESCLRSYYENDIFLENVFKDDIAWMSQLPIILEFKELKDEDGRYAVASHSHVSNIWKGYKNSNLAIGYITQHVLWGRPHKLKNTKDIYNIIGHTPNADNPRIKSFYANIDTGAFCGLPKWNSDKPLKLGKLTALQFPEKIIYQQDCIDVFPKYESAFGDIDKK